jgi:uncharacterized protein YndB with AHSA1/START domain
MTRNEITIEAPPDAVFRVLSDPRSFARWVVGSQVIRRADRDWPAPGAAFDHSVGLGPFTISDSTEVLTSHAPHELRLLVRARPLSQAFVTLSLTDLGPATRVRMEEHPADARSRVLFNPLTDPFVRLRNSVSLRRLKALAEGIEPLPTGFLPERGSEVEGHVTARSSPATRWHDAPIG